MRNEESDNPLWKHTVVEHGGEEPEFKMKVVEKQRSALKRQIQEWVTIAREGKKNVILNSKSEWNAEKIPRVTIDNNEKCYLSNENMGVNKAAISRTSKRKAEPPRKPPKAKNKLINDMFQKADKFKKVEVIGENNVGTMEEANIKNKNIMGSGEMEANMRSTDIRYRGVGGGVNLEANIGNKKDLIAKWSSVPKTTIRSKMNSAMLKVSSSQSRKQAAAVDRMPQSSGCNKKQIIEMKVEKFDFMLGTRGDSDLGDDISERTKT